MSGPMHSESPVAVTDHGAVRHLHMTGRPRRGNPLGAALVEALLAAMAEAEADDAVAALVLSGTDTHFSVGADLHEVAALSATAAILARWLDDIDRLARCTKPVVAAVRGHAVGGGFELALGCDLMVCGEAARLSLPETGIGVIAGQGGTQRLIQRAGRTLAADLILTGRVLDGREALAHGIAARCVPDGEVVGAAIAVAAAIADRSRPAIRFAREILHEAAEGPQTQSMRIGRLLAALVLDTDECRRRVGAFLEERRS